MSDIHAALAEHLENEEAALPEEKLGLLSDLCHQLCDKEEEVSAAEDHLASVKAEAQELRARMIPDLMAELGLMMLKLDNGSSVTIQDVVHAKINQEKKQEALSWLVEHGHGSIVKTNVVTRFDRGDRDKAVELAKELSAGHDVQLDESVHAMTLKKFAKDAMADGVDIPQDLIAVDTFRMAKIK